MASWIHRALPRKSTPPIGDPRGRARLRRLCIALGWLVAVVVQCALLWLVAELVEVAHGLMELWLELANQQLDLVSIYNAVRPE